MNVNVQGIRRNVKNVVRNYTDAQVRQWLFPYPFISQINKSTFDVEVALEVRKDFAVFDKRRFRD